MKPLKFSAYHDGIFYGSIDQFFKCLGSSSSDDSDFADNGTDVSVPYLSVDVIRDSAQEVLEKIAYTDGKVDLNKICSALCVDLQFTKQEDQDEDGNSILGSMNFDRKSILIYSHSDNNRERFTIAHEIGHFCLNHGRYLRSEYIVERDLIVRDDEESGFNYERLEFQANTFASDLILPFEMFRRQTAEYRRELEIHDRGHGYIFVDDQPCNYGPYNQLLLSLSSYFGVSKQAIEIKLKKNGMLTDQRKKRWGLSIPMIMSDSGT